MSKRIEHITSPQVFYRPVLPGNTSKRITGNFTGITKAKNQTIGKTAAIYSWSHNLSFTLLQVHTGLCKYVLNGHKGHFLYEDVAGLTPACRL